jgi:hypothetical protein
LHRFFFAADSRLQQTKHAAASTPECFLKRSAASRTGRNLSGWGLHLLGPSGEARLDQTEAMIARSFAQSLLETRVTWGAT